MEGLTHAALGIFDFVNHPVHGQIDETPRDFSQERFELQTLFKGFRGGP
jgi:hypothetical protein